LDKQMSALAPLVEKTGGKDEKTAFGLLLECVARTTEPSSVAHP